VIQESKNMDWKNRSKEPTLVLDDPPDAESAEAEEEESDTERGGKSEPSSASRFRISMPLLLSSVRTFMLALPQRARTAAPGRKSFTGVIREGGLGLVGGQEIWREIQPFFLGF